MSYYPIKCIKCGALHDNKTVKFDVQDLFMKSRSMNNQRVTKNNDQEFNWDDDGQEATSIRTGYDQTSKNMTFNEMESNYYSAIPIEYDEDVIVTKDFKGKPCTGDWNERLWIGVRIKLAENSPEIDISKRVCAECGCELPEESGKMPTYNVAMIGTTSSGKTVFLGILTKLQPRSHLYNGKLVYTGINASNDSFKKIAEKMIKTGTLPGTTQSGWDEPLVMKYTFTQYQDKQNKLYKKECMVAFSDIRGEDFNINKDNENLRNRIISFRRSDAYIMLVNPKNIPLIAKTIPAALKDNDCDTEGKQHFELSSTLSMYFGAHSRSSIPTVVAISQCDILINHAKTFRINSSNAVVNTTRMLRDNENYFISHNKGAKLIVDMDKQLSGTIDAHFRNVDYISFSSLGCAVSIVRDKDDKRIDNPNLISPIRVYDPIELLLIKVGFMPKYTEMKIGDRFDRHNQNILKEWQENAYI